MRLTGISPWFAKHGDVMFTPELVHLRQLCRLEISGALLASVLFQELKDVIPCDAITLLWRESGATSARLLHESDTDVSCGFIDAWFFAAIDSALNNELFTVLAAQHPVLRKLAQHLPGNHALDADGVQTVAVSIRAGEKPAGVILVHRCCGHPFSTKEKSVLIRLAPMLAAALSANTGSAQLTASETNAGIFLLDRGMHIQYACSRGRKLLQLAQASNGLSARSGDSDLMQQLRNNLDAQHRAQTPKFIVHNGWGSFEFLLHRLSDTEINSDQLTAVAVHRQEPLALCVFRGCRKLALTEKQTEIALLLIKGHSNDQVATKLQISTTTVADHVRKIYDKVGASNRSELVTTLLLGEKNTAHLWPSKNDGVEKFRLPPVHPVRMNQHIKGPVRGNVL